MERTVRENIQRRIEMSVLRFEADAREEILSFASTYAANDSVVIPSAEAQEEYADILVSILESSYSDTVHASMINVDLVRQGISRLVAADEIEPENDDPNQLGENDDPNDLDLELGENDKYGTPALKLAIDALSNMKITDSSSLCAVCQDTLFEQQGKQMPCKHIYHADCILRWLQLHNSCPVCRYELPTESESKPFGDSSTAGENVGGSDPNFGQHSQQMAEPERIPWPFRRETSNSGGNNSGNRGSQN